jgi:NADH:ubiquinone oxidoreductase subunit 5 (subunit L)/multisubunit Na+/H+ antiporter MnhA subunit
MIPRPAADGRACVDFTAPLWLALAGVALSYYMYMVNPALPAAIKARVQPIYTLLDNKYYMDWFNENVLARGARALGTGLWKGGDQAVIDGAIVNGSWKLVGRWRRSGALVPVGLPVPLRAGDDPWRVCADDVFRVVQQVGEQEKWDC